MMSPPGYQHSLIVARITHALFQHIVEQKSGAATGTEGGFVIGRDPDTVRAPDVALVRAERNPPAKPAGFFEGAPDLAVEVLAPSDRTGETFEKVQDWLAAGCRLVWVVDPRTRTVTQYSIHGEVAVLAASDTLAGGDVLPSFSIPVAEIFADV